MLVRRLIDEMPELTALTCVDLSTRWLPKREKLRLVAGDLIEESVFQEVFDTPVDLVFHLATVPGGWAEDHFETGMQANLMLTIRILEALRKQKNRPRLVYTSSIGVFGNMETAVDDDTNPSPTWSYGTHKLMGELLIADYTRKHFVDGRTIRLPAVVARGADPSGAVSAFMSDMIRLLGNGQKFQSPVSAGATCWWMSRQCAVDNILHAARVAGETFPARRVYTLPALRCSIEEVVDAVGRVSGHETRSLVNYQPVVEVENRFGKLPPLHVPRAEGCGFHHDGTVDEMVKNALRGLAEES